MDTSAVSSEGGERLERLAQSSGEDEEGGATGVVSATGAGKVGGSVVKRRRPSVRKPRTKGIVKKLQDQVLHVGLVCVYVCVDPLPRVISVHHVHMDGPPRTVHVIR